MIRYKTLLSLIATLLLMSCQQSTVTGGKTEAMAYATLLHITDLTGYRQVDITNPWDTTQVPQTLFLVDRESDMSSGDINALRSRGTVVRTPLHNVLCDSEVHESLGSMLGVAEAMRYTGYPLPPAEQLMASKPDALLFSPYEGNTVDAKLQKMGIPVILCADYMEISPLGRAEWMRLYGMLLGRESVADSLFNVVEQDYHAAASDSRETPPVPSIIFDTRYGQTWYQPAGGSTIGMLIRDAGATTPWIDHPESGSLALSQEQVLAKGSHAALWLLRFSGTGNLTLDALGREDPLYKQFEAYKNGNVWATNPTESNYFRETPWRPDWLLQELKHIIRGSEKELRYFYKVK